MLIVQEVVAILTTLKIPYALGGSMASSFSGHPRFTADADISVSAFPGRESELVSRFGPDYYISLAAVEQAVRDRSCFNIVHTKTGFKVDVFVCKDRAFDQSLIARARSARVSDGFEDLVIVSPEDIVLLKLEWYQLGFEASERQWSDILGVLSVQKGRLDEAYLDRWAQDLAVTELLAKARKEAGI